MREPPIIRILCGFEASQPECLSDPLPFLIANGLKGRPDDCSAYATQNRQGLLHSVMHIQKWFRVKNTDQWIKTVIYLSGGFQFALRYKVKEACLKIGGNTTHPGNGTVCAQRETGEQGHGKA
jgi:hypothetical protein